jgi:hypothetical protein
MPVKKSVRKLVNAGIHDERGGVVYYSNLIKQLKASGASPKQIAPFVKSLKDEKLHLRRLHRV